MSGTSFDHQPPQMAWQQAVRKLVTSDILSQRLGVNKYRDAREQAVKYTQHAGRKTKETGKTFRTSILGSVVGLFWRD